MTWRRQNGNNRRVCSVGGCDKYAQRRGLCRAHGAPRTTCRRDGCVRHAILGGVCRTHGAAGKPCSVEGCDNVAQRQSMCKRHFRLVDALTTAVSNGSKGAALVLSQAVPAKVASREPIETSLGQLLLASARADPDSRDFHVDSDDQLCHQPHRPREESRRNSAAVVSRAQLGVSRDPHSAKDDSVGAAAGASGAPTDALESVNQLAPFRLLDARQMQELLLQHSDARAGGSKTSALSAAELLTTLGKAVFFPADVPFTP